MFETWFRTVLRLIINSCAIVALPLPAATISRTSRSRSVSDGNAAVGSLVLMGIALLFFATAVRNLLRSSEAREATYSSIAYGGWIVVVAGLGQMVVLTWAMINGAADTGDDAALHVLSYSGYFGFAGMGIGIATAFLAIGLGGIRNAVLPKWFAIATVVLAP